jgi:hypothetical protein
LICHFDFIVGGEWPMQRINKREYMARLRNGKRVFRTRHGFWSMPTHQQWERLIKKWMYG